MPNIESITLEPNPDGSKDVTLLANGKSYTMENINKITGDLRILLRFPVTSAVLTSKGLVKIYQLFTERSCISFYGS